MLNILPPEKKDELRHALAYKQVRLVCVIMMIVVVAITGTITTSQLLLQRWQTSLAGRQTVAGISETDRNTLQKKLTDLTAVTTGITTVDAKFHNPVTLLATLLKSIPTTVHLTTIELDYSTGLLTLGGVVDDRTDLLTLQKQLSDNTALTNIELPINDFTVKTSIPFTLNATMVNAKTTF